MTLSGGLVTLTMRLSCTCSVRLQPHAAVGADRVGGGLRSAGPIPRRPHRPFGHWHERAGRAHGDAVPAVHACRLRQGDVVRSRDVGVEATTGDGDGEGVLPVDPAGVDALVAQDALAVVTDVQVVVVLDRDPHGGRVVAEARGLDACSRSIPPLAPSGWSTDRPRSRAARGRACGPVPPVRCRYARPCPPRPLREQAGTSVRDPSSSTRRPGRRWRVRWSARSTASVCRRRRPCKRRAGSPSATLTAGPSTVTSTGGVPIHPLPWGFAPPRRGSSGHRSAP